MTTIADGNETGKEQPVPGSKGLILLVEDEICIRIVAREILEAVGYQVAEAVDGLDGLEKFLANQDEIVLVILDLVMPRMHGFQVMDGIRTASPTTPILLSSGYSPEEHPEVLVPTPILGFLPKPYRTRDLQTQVSRLLGVSAS